MAEHKHAEVLRAIADGKAVQWQSRADGSWNDRQSLVNPLSEDFLNWRVKPEPKPDVVRFVNVYVDGLLPLSLGEMRHSVEECNKVNFSSASAVAKFTVNGETRKVSVEIVE